MTHSFPHPNIPLVRFKCALVPEGEGGKIPFSLRDKGGDEGNALTGDSVMYFGMLNNELRRLARGPLNYNRAVLNNSMGGQS